MLLQGVDFSSKAFWEPHTGRSRVGRVLRGLLDSGVIASSGARGKGKYRLSDEFLGTVGQDIARSMPRGTFLHYPALRVFDVCGIGNWTEEELSGYLERLKEHWRIRSQQRGNEDDG